jgi:hypothetical protein
LENSNHQKRTFVLKWIDDFLVCLAVQLSLWLIGICIFGGTFPSTRQTCTGNCAVVASTEQSAESVSFQRHQPNHPPTQNVDSVATAELPARRFGGLYAQDATKESFRANFVQISHLVQQISHSSNTFILN